MYVQSVMEQIFEQDPAKDEINYRKHGIRFKQAKNVFADPFALTRQDRIENGEERWQTIGTIENTMIVLVAHTVRCENAEIIRIISARKLSRKERKIYEYGSN